jgi:transcription factor SPT20 homolog
LLEKLVRKENFNSIVLNLYPFDAGYTISFNVKEKIWADPLSINEKLGIDMYISQLNQVETKPVPYGENEFMYYVNVGEIPPILIDILDRLKVNLFYDGCLIMEIRDYRRRSNAINVGSCDIHAIKSLKFYDTFHVLLQPSMQTLLADLNSITFNDGTFVWTQEDKYALESQLLLATAQPLCLNPSPLVSIVKSRLLNSKQKLNDKKLKR